ncbi:PepSY-associated TM helix domain-containing protein, partial [Ottowia sp.]|uniref:PepSY-associated TM helix domain-containing protein n=1 Tax=Ottowia sp. TaxID=1898956 RepID=UPI0039E62D3E
MRPGFRQAQAWWHTWAGLICGWLLFAIFFTGTTAVFREQGQHWLAPELHRPAAAARLDARRMVEAAERVLRAGEPRDDFVWFVRLPDAHGAAFSATRARRAVPGMRPEDRVQTWHLDAATGEVLAEQPRASQAMNTLYQFHFSLLMRGKALGVPQLGVWIVGAMTVVMLVLLVSGVIVHKKIFTDFFTFRPAKAPARSWLDAHNVSSVMVLPFALMICYTGLVIFWSIWMPFGMQAVYDKDLTAFAKDMGQHIEIARQPGEPAPTLPLWSFVEKSQAQVAPGQTLRLVQVISPGGKQTQVRVLHKNDSALWGGSDMQWFNGATGELLLQEVDEGRAADVTQKVMRILHEIRFAGPVLRWLYFLMSTGCCVMIATGLVLWTVKRREKALKLVKKGELDHRRMWGWRIAEALNVGTVAGILTATAAMFWSNRLISAQLPGRDAWEIRVFFGVWLLCALWALARVRWLTVPAALPSPQPSPRGRGSFFMGELTPRRLWAQQLGAAAGLYALIPVV